MHYKLYCKILKRVINEARKQSFHKQITTSTNKIKTAWKIVKETLGNTSPDGSITKIRCRGTLTDDPTEIANALNKYYINITENTNIRNTDKSEAETLLKNHILENTVQTRIIPVTEYEITSIIKSLKSKITAGYDEISTKILKKQCAYYKQTPNLHL